MIETQKTEQRRRHGHFWGLSKASGDRMFSAKHWPEVKKQAEATGLLEFNKRYSDGRNGYQAFAASARLAWPYRNGGFEEYQLARKPRSKQEKATRLGAVETWLAAKLPLFTLPDDVTSTDLWTSFSLHCWRSEEFYATTCEYGRLHTNATSLVKHARERLDCGEPLVQCDIKNSQPLILGRVLQGLADPEELREWIALGEAGIIYEWCLEAVKDLGISDYTVHIPAQFAQDGSELKPARQWTEMVRKWERKHVKKSMLVMLFAPIEQTQQSLVWQAVKKYFPTIADAIIRYKQGGHQRLAHVCQRFESNLMIRAVGSAMIPWLNESPVFTVHDSWTVPERFETKITEVTKQKFEEKQLKPIVEATKLDRPT
ncbi:MAG TPA: hypothetical protein DDW52_16660 [Planctomycetaceae bacterium]|nr:hypothetical protein [Planctomycetaceae bacterium]